MTISKFPVGTVMSFNYGAHDLPDDKGQSYSYFIVITGPSFIAQISYDNPNDVDSLINEVSEHLEDLGRQDAYLVTEEKRLISIIKRHREN